MLAFLSPRSIGKVGYVQRELRHALRHRDRRPLGNRFIIPVLVEACDVPDEFRSMHFMTLANEDDYPKLVRALRAK